MRTLKKLVICFCVAAAVASGVWAQELKADEIIARHIEAIGKQEARAGLQTLMAVGLSSFESDAPVVKGGGKAVVVSDKDNLFFVISLNSREYPFEKIGFFGEKLSLPLIPSGVRSLLGSFISEHPAILSEGLFSGGISRRWVFLDNEKKPKVKTGGTKKVDDLKTYVLEYFVPKSSSEFTVKMYFDAGTFHLVRTEYRRDVPARSPVFGRQNTLANSILVLTENFSDFRTIDGLTLPFNYSVEFYSNSGSTTFKNTWGIKVSQYYLNQKLAPDFFTFDTK